jgi:hypothetical protein
MKKTLLITTALASIALAPCAARAETSIDQLQTQMQTMMKRISALEAENTKLKENVSTVQTQVKNVADLEPAAGEKKADGKKGDIALPGGSTLKLGGYIKADAIYDIGTGAGTDFATFAAIPLNSAAAAQRGNDFLMHARQSRFNLTSTTPTSIGDVKAFAEVDFFGTRGTDLATNGHAPQLRQAYGQVGGLLAGQAWSNWVDMDALPESLDYVGPAGVTILRQVQVRYSDKLADGFSYSVSAENPFSDITKNAGNAVTPYEKMPDLTVALTSKGDWGHLTATAVLRDISMRDDVTGRSFNEFGGGAALAGAINTIDKDNLKFRVAYGNGLGRYIFDSVNAASSNGAAYNSAAAGGARMELETMFAAYAAYQHNWTDTLRSNLLGGYTHIENNVTLLGTGFNKEIYSGHVNLIWQPVKAYRVGAEYMHGFRKLDVGTHGQLDRAQVSFIYPLN